MMCSQFLISRSLCESKKVCVTELSASTPAQSAVQHGDVVIATHNSTLSSDQISFENVFQLTTRSSPNNKTDFSTPQVEILATYQYFSPHSAMAKDSILSQVGDFGLYQKLLCGIFVFYTTFLCGLNYYTQVGSYLSLSLHFTLFLPRSSSSSRLNTGALTLCWTLCSFNTGQVGRIFCPGYPDSRDTPSKKIISF